MSSNITPRVVTYCAQECAWQKRFEGGTDGATAVARMVEAWRYAMRYRNQPIKARDIIALGRLVEPEKNWKGYRDINVRVGNDVKVDWRDVSGRIDRLLEHQPPVRSSAKVASDFFKAFEEVHPFVDGNGRVGSLLHCWVLGVLPVPIHFPNLWKDHFREYKGYPEPNLDPSIWTPSEFKPFVFDGGYTWK